MGTSIFVRHTTGHADWAHPRNLAIPTSVDNCVHMVAMHELRKTFPLDDVADEKGFPPNCTQRVYPGAHCDVGGGYAPGEMGVAAHKNLETGDSLKLSQITLNHMYACARKAGVPLDKALAVDPRTLFDPFVIHPDTQRAYDRFLEFQSTDARPLHEWLLPYLAWRWQVRDQIQNTKQHQTASASDRRLLVEANELLCAQAYEMKNPVVTDREPEARRVFELTKQASGTLPGEVADFFDRYVHDSYAGFLVGSFHEPTGYWRWRRIFQGNNVAITGDDAAVPAEYTSQQQTA
jgi:hypothetical protein